VSANVYLEVDGRPVRARECTWIDTAPCGCISGVMVAESGGEVYLNAEQAAARYYSNAVARKRAEAEGFVLSLTTHEAFRAMGWDDCPHDPKWGVAHVEPPEGWEWGTADGGFGRQTHIKHMIPAGNALTRESRNWREWPQPLPALCGASRRGSHWRAVDWTVDVEPCLKCETKATERAS
jgi:hypothetical protein